ncbi:hypothetical protein CASFOL_034155 [Castilleja foliolosa]|uniref:Uncharacterized protein n=1 Tax=Castilleja foliolosa TaxID=1961234 RepID=A0ABD3BXD4_9LAMI
MDFEVIGLIVDLRGTQGFVGVATNLDSIVMALRGTQESRRLWKEILSGIVGFFRGIASYGGANLLGRIDRLEEDLQSAGSIVQAFPSRLEKLGIRFKVARKALEEPINVEIAPLVQKKFETARALAVQEDNLELELGEIQKVLVAMEEQQQKQLELILAIEKAGKAAGGQTCKKAGKLQHSFEGLNEIISNRRKMHILIPFVLNLFCFLRRATFLLIFPVEGERAFFNILLYM